MEFEIYEEAKKEEDKKIRLRLIKSGTEGITLVVCDDDGKTKPVGSLLTIDGAGQLHLHLDIGVRFGLNLTEDGRLKLC